MTECKNESDGGLVNCKLIRERLKLTCQGCVMLLGNGIWGLVHNLKKMRRLNIALISLTRERKVG